MLIWRIKPGVSLRGAAPEILFALGTIGAILYQFSLTEAWITSCTDGQHSRGSLHYIGHAVDVRSRDLSAPSLAQAVKQMQDALGAEFDVVAESTHLHIEYQPKTPIGG